MHEGHFLILYTQSWIERESMAPALFANKEVLLSHSWLLFVLIPLGSELLSVLYQGTPWKLFFQNISQRHIWV